MPPWYRSPTNWVRMCRNLPPAGVVHHRDDSAPITVRSVVSGASVIRSASLNMSRRWANRVPILRVGSAAISPAVIESSTAGVSARSGTRLLISRVPVPVPVTLPPAPPAASALPPVPLSDAAMGSPPDGRISSGPSAGDHHRVGQLHFGLLVDRELVELEEVHLPQPVDVLEVVEHLLLVLVACDQTPGHAQDEGDVVVALVGPHVRPRPLDVVLAEPL